MKKIIEIRNLKKTFGDVVAVDDISFSVKEGELFAFLGLNGAGKSTTINILCGIYGADSGEVLIDGIDISTTQDFKTKIGVVYQDSALDKTLSVLQNLTVRGALYGLYGESLRSRLEKIDEMLNISPLYNKIVGKLSGGQKRRVDIARAILHSPQILILDEPTTGLDPQTRKVVWQALNQMRKDFHITIFLTTHYMEEASDANNIVILDSGKIVAQGTPLQLKNKYTGDFILLYNAIESDVKKLGLPYEVMQECYKIEIKNTSKATELIMKYPEIFVDYEIAKGKLDDVFLAVTGKNLSEGK